MSTERKAWEIHEDNTATPVEVLSKYRNMFGYWKVLRADGSTEWVHNLNLRSADDLDRRYKSPESRLA